MRKIALLCRVSAAFLIATLLLHICKLTYELDSGADGHRKQPPHKIYRSYSEGHTSVTFRSPQCGCVRTLRTASSPPAASSSCSVASTLRGDGQSVISYTLYGDALNVSSPYFAGMVRNVQQAKEIYPGWVVRIYAPPAAELRKQLCVLVCDNVHVDWCDVSSIPDEGDVATWLNPQCWRFLVLGDPTVKVFLVRDSDSYLSRRERAAVDEWLLGTSAAFHVMRDHPFHDAAMLAGMWGGRNDDAAALTTELRRTVLRTSERHPNYSDQDILQAVVWPVAKSAGVVGHDSYFCDKYEGGVSWPTRRRDGFDFVGSRKARMSNDAIFRGKTNGTCPPQCRPTQHPHWTTC